MLLAISWNAASGLHWSNGIWDPQGDQRLNMYELYSEMSLGSLSGSALGHCMVKAQARVVSSLEIQRLSWCSLLDTRLIKWFTSGGEVTEAHKKGSFWLNGIPAYVIFQISLWRCKKMRKGWERASYQWFQYEIHKVASSKGTGEYRF